MVPRRGKLWELEGLRGVAALVVFSGHYVLNFMPEQNASLSGTLFYGPLNGPAAVILFFVLSGFVLALRPIQAGRLSALVAPILRRWPRLAGTVVVSGLFYIAAARTGAFPSPSTVVSTIPVNPLPILTWGWGRGATNAGAVLWEAAVGTFFMGTAQHNDVLWTMYWELLGSILTFGLAGVLVLAFSTRARVAAFVGVAIGATAYNPNLGCFALGAGFAAFHARRAVVIPAWVACSLTALALAIFSWDIRAPTGIWAWTLTALGSQATPLWILAQSVAAAALIATALYNPVARQVLSGTMGTWAGRLSFPIYLLHLLVLCSFTSWAYLLLFKGGLGLGSGLLLFACTTAVTVAVAYPLARFDEWWVTALGLLGLKRPTLAKPALVANEFPPIRLTLPATSKDK